MKLNRLQVTVLTILFSSSLSLAASTVGTKFIASISTAASSHDLHVSCDAAGRTDSGLDSTPPSLGFFAGTVVVDE